MDSIKEQRLVPFEKELEHTKTYLSIEKLRFEEQLNIVYDIKTTSFLIPQLSLQPIVENAVKYGACSKIEGGTVKISTCETQKDYRITVEDDGQGFDINEKKDDNKSHIGIENVKSRLMSMCGGSLIIKSKKNIGTIATIIVPKT